MFDCKASPSQMRRWFCSKIKRWRVFQMDVWVFIFTIKLYCIKGNIYPYNDSPSEQIGIFCSPPPISTAAIEQKEKHKRLTRTQSKEEEEIREKISTTSEEEGRNIFSKQEESWTTSMPPPPPPPPTSKQKPGKKPWHRRTVGPKRRRRAEFFCPNLLIGEIHRKIERHSPLPSKKNHEVFRFFKKYLFLRLNVVECLPPPVLPLRFSPPPSLTAIASSLLCRGFSPPPPLALGSKGNSSNTIPEWRRRRHSQIIEKMKKKSNEET